MNSHVGSVRVLRGSVSKNVVAQQGLFTVHPILAQRGGSTDSKGLEHFMLGAQFAPISNLTLPVEQSVRLFELCHRNGFRAARLFPGADGATRQVQEEMQYSMLYNEPTTQPSGLIQLGLWERPQMAITPRFGVCLQITIQHRNHLRIPSPVQPRPV